MVSFIFKFYKINIYFFQLLQMQHVVKVKKEQKTLKSKKEELRHP